MSSSNRACDGSRPGEDLESCQPYWQRLLAAAQASCKRITVAQRLRDCRLLAALAVWRRCCMSCTLCVRHKAGHGGCSRTQGCCSDRTGAPPCFGCGFHHLDAACELASIARCAAAQHRDESCHATASASSTDVTLPRQLSLLWRGQSAAELAHHQSVEQCAKCVNQSIHQREAHC